MRMYYGCRYRKKDFLYANEWDEVGWGSLLPCTLASRAPTACVAHAVLQGGHRHPA